MPHSVPQAPLLDSYVRENRVALEVFDDRGQFPFHGVSRRTLAALARRGLVWFEHDTRGGLTPKGRAALVALADERGVA